MSQSLVKLAHEGQLFIWDTTQERADEVTSELRKQGVIVRAESGIDESCESLSVISGGGSTSNLWETCGDIGAVFDLMGDEGMMKVSLAKA